MSEENQEQVATTEEGKESNRTFTQSDFDKMVAKKEKELSDRFKDYEDLKTKAETFEKLKAEQEQAKLSEIEKANLRAKELEDKLNNLISEKTVLEKKTLKFEVLSDPKYSALPNAYKKIIDGSTVDELKASAEEALKEFEEVLKSVGGKNTNVGLPPTNTTKTEPQKPISLSEAFMERLNRKAQVR
jgi:predicted RNase H-like HicB family nuclease